MLRWGRSSGTPCAFFWGSRTSEDTEPAVLEASFRGVGSTGTSWPQRGPEPRGPAVLTGNSLKETPNNV